MPDDAPPANEFNDCNPSNQGDPLITKFHIKAYAIDFPFGPCPLPWANSA